MGRVRLRGHRRSGHPGRSRRPPPQWWRRRKLECEPDDPRTGAYRRFLRQPDRNGIRLAGNHGFADRNPLDHGRGQWLPVWERQRHRGCERFGYAVSFADLQP